MFYLLPIFAFIVAISSALHEDYEAPSMSVTGDVGLQDIVKGWNVSVGTQKERTTAAEFFHVNVTDKDSLWLDNVMTPFIGKTMKMIDIDIEERNAFNSIIEHSVKTGTVLWTIEQGPPGCMGTWLEHINEKFSGAARIAGFVSPNSWIENDYKQKFGIRAANDWGIINVESRTSDTVVMKYWSYKKAKFTMTWTTQF